MRPVAGLPAKHRIVLAVARLVFTIRHPCTLEPVDIIADSSALS